jgi:hypothetical protein
VKTETLLVLAGLLALQVGAQSVLFDFENAPRYTPLPISLTVGGITAQFSATRQGFSIQSPTSAGVIPVGFSGNCIFPSSIYAADLTQRFQPANTSSPTRRRQTNRAVSTASSRRDAPPPSWRPLTWAET